MDYKEFIKTRFDVIATILSFVTLLVGVFQAFSASTKIIALSLLIAGSLGLFFTNIWMRRAKLVSVLDPSEVKPRYRKGLVLTIHLSSLTLLVVCWIVVLITMSPKLYAYTLFNFGRYQSAIHEFEVYHQRSNGTIDSHFALADCYENISDYISAVSTLEEVLKKEGFVRELESPNGQSFKGKLHIRLGQLYIVESYNEQYRMKFGVTNSLAYQSGIHHLTLALVHDKENLLIHWLLGFTKAANDKESVSKEKRQKASLLHFEDAMEIITSKYKAFDSSLYNKLLAETNYWLGKALIALDDNEKAKEVLEEGLRLWPTEESKKRDMFLVQLATAQLGIGGDMEEAKIYLSQVVDKQHYARSLLISGLSHWEEARNLFGKEGFEEKCQQAELEFIAADKLGSVGFRVHMLLGTLYYMKEDYTKADIHFKEWVRYTADSPLGLSYVVKNLMKLGKWKEAKTYALHWTTTAPKDAEAHYHLGVILGGDLKDNDASIKELEKAVELDRDNSNYHYFLATILYNKSNSSPNLESDQVIALNERLLDALQIALKLVNKENGDRRKVDLEEFQLRIWNRLAYGYAQQGKNLILAKNYIDKALATDANNIYWLDTKAWILLVEIKSSKALTVKQKEYILVSAEELLNRALSGLTEQHIEARPEILFHYGYLEKLRGQYSKAKEYFLEALELNPEYEQAKIELERLNM